jgi:photosystem II oxygen-evolving enhancer protein 3
MAQTMASMTGLSQGVRLPGPAGRRASRLTVRASAEAETAGRRAVLGLMATAVAGGAFAQAAHAGTVAAIKVGPPPPPSGGLRECLYPLLIHRCITSLHFRVI